MDTADRLQELMGILKLNPNQFAKDLGYERPEKIYGILNKKFKPSFDTLMDILTHYPAVNANWLLKGEEAMFKTENKVSKEPNEINNWQAQQIKWLETQVLDKEKQIADKERIIALLEKQIVLLENSR